MEMKMRVETLPNYRLAYVRKVGPYGNGNMEAMEQLKDWAARNNLMSSALIFGIPQDNPTITLPENCRYDACVVITNDFKLDVGSIAETEFSGGKYAVFLVKHTEDAIQQAWIDIFTSIENSNYQMDNKPIIERYTADMISHDYCELCVPLI